MASALGELLLRIDADSARLRSELGKAGKDVATFAGRIADSAKNISELLTFEVIIHGVEKFATFVSESATAARELSNLSQILGVDVEQMQKLGFAARMVGVETEHLVKGMERMSRNMMYALTGQGKAGTGFKALGIDIKDSEGALKGETRMLMEVADAFSQYRDGAEKTALAVMLFGRAGAELIPLLNQGKVGIEKWLEQAEKFDRVISNETLENAGRFAEDIDKIRGAVEMYGISVAGQLGPYFHELITYIAGSEDQMKVFKEAARETSATVRHLVVGLAALGWTFNELGRSIGAVSAIVAELFQGTPRTKDAGIKEIVRQWEIDLKASTALLLKIQEMMLQPPPIPKQWSVPYPYEEPGARPLPYDMSHLGLPKPNPPLVTNDKSVKNAIKQIEEEIERLNQKGKTALMDPADTLRWSAKFGHLAQLLKDTGLEADKLRGRLFAAIDVFEKGEKAKATQKTGLDAWYKLNEEVERQQLALVKVEEKTKTAAMAERVLNGDLAVLLSVLRNISPEMAKAADNLQNFLMSAAWQQDEQAAIEKAEAAYKKMSAEILRVKENTSKLGLETELALAKWDIKNGQFAQWKAEMLKVPGNEKRVAAAEDDYRAAALALDIQRKLTEEVKRAKQTYHELMSPLQKYREEIDFLNSEGAQLLLTQNEINVAMQAAKDKFKEAGGMMSEFTRTLVTASEAGFIDAIMGTNDAIEAQIDRYQQANENAARWAAEHYGIHNEQMDEAARNAKRRLEELRGPIESIAHAFEGLAKGFLTAMETMLSKAMATDLLGALGLGTEGGAPTDILNSFGNWLGIGKAWAPDFENVSMGLPGGVPLKPDLLDNQGPIWEFDWGNTAGLDKQLEDIGELKPQVVTATTMTVVTTSTEQFWATALEAETINVATLNAGGGGEGGGGIPGDWLGDFLGLGGGGGDTGGGLPGGIPWNEDNWPGGMPDGDVWDIDWGSVGGRATGGPTVAGNPYIIGEKGPELFVPSTSGSVMKTEDLVAALGAGKSRSSTTNMNVNIDPAYIDMTMRDWLDMVLAKHLATRS